MRRAAFAAAATSYAYATLRRYPPGGAERWQRSNYRGGRPTLLAGPAVAGGAALAAFAGSPPAGLLTASCGALGLYDDLAGDVHARGLRGHVAALREGRVTTGMIKLVGLASAGAAAGIIAPGGRRSVRRLAVDTALVAGTANLVNLFDLRPGRAAKVVVLAGLPLAAYGAPGAAAAVGAAAAALPADLAEQAMIGDCGANALGALLGWAAARGFGRVGRFGALGLVVGLTLASERVSFSAVIDRTPWLAAADRLGRRSP